MDVPDGKRPFTPKFLRLLKNNLNKDYLKSSNGLLRLGQIIALVTSFSALAHFKIIVLSPNLICYIFMTANILVCLANMVLFCVSFFSLNKMKIAPRTSKILIIMYSGIAGNLLLVLSTLLAVEAAHIKNTTNLPNTDKCTKCGKINIAAVFGFLSWILFTVEWIQNMMQCRCSKTQVSHIDVKEFETADQI